MSKKKDEKNEAVYSLEVLDSCEPGDVVYCREREGKFGVTTTARFDARKERVEVNPETGKERIVVDYYLWDLRHGRQIVNPTNAWQTAEYYAKLRNDGKVKIAGDVIAQEKHKAKIQKAVETAA